METFRTVLRARNRRTSARPSSQNSNISEGSSNHSGSKSIPSKNVVIDLTSETEKSDCENTPSRMNTRASHNVSLPQSCEPKPSRPRRQTVNTTIVQQTKTPDTGKLNKRKTETQQEEQNAEKENISTPTNKRQRIESAPVSAEKQSETKKDFAAITESVTVDCVDGWTADECKSVKELLMKRLREDAEPEELIGQSANIR